MKWIQVRRREREAVWEDMRLRLSNVPEMMHQTA